VTRVKICGIRSEEELRMAVNAGAHAVGFITEVPVPTPRRVTLAQASRLISMVPVFVTSVLVIMPESAQDAINMIHTAKPLAVQIHNDLELSELKKIKETGVKLIKTISIPINADSSAIIEQINECKGIADAILLDTMVKGKSGGTGLTHDWEISSEIVRSSSMPIILAGGLNPENVRDAIMKVKPYAVDVASGVETNGRKDVKKIIDFMKKVGLHEF